MRHRRRRSLVAVLVIIIAVAVIVAVIPRFVNRVILGRHWPTAEQVSIERIEHDGWGRLLETYVSNKGEVDYAAWKAKPVDVRALDDYLAELGRADTALPASHEAVLAYWINAYNALTVRGILREYPTTSIRNHTRWFGYHIWRDFQLIVGEDRHSLEGIEHQILRSMGEPRIHFAIVCASAGCPPLRDEAYVAERLEQQLAENAREFLRRPGNFRADAAARRIYLSQILQLFAGDFGPDQSAILRAIAPYLPDDESRQLAISGRVVVSYLEYDWSLNEQRAARTDR